MAGLENQAFGLLGKHSTELHTSSGNTVIFRVAKEALEGGRSPPSWREFHRGIGKFLWGRAEVSESLRQLGKCGGGPARKWSALGGRGCYQMMADAKDEGWR